MVWLTGWNIRKQLSISSTNAGTQSNYQLKLIVYYGSGTDTAGNIYCGGNAKSDFSDIRFTSSDGSTQLYYWIDPNNTVNGSYATVWVKIPSIPYPGTTNIYVYYSNITPPSDGYKSSTNTFIVFDDFSTNTWGDWNYFWGNSCFLVQNYRMEHTACRNATSSNFAIVLKGSSTVPTPKFVMEYTANTLATGCKRGYGWAIWSDSTHWIAYCSVGGTGCGNYTSNSGYTITWNQQTYITSPAEFKVQVVYDGSRLRTYFNGVLYWDFTVALNTNNRFGFYEQESSVLSENSSYYDDLRVRNYASPEPTWGIIGTEELSTISAIAFFMAGD